jgi:hypothetical protein
MGQLHFLFLAIRETGHAFALHEWFTLICHPVQDAGRVAYQGNRLAGIVERLE